MTPLATTDLAEADTHEQAMIPNPSAHRTERVPAVLPRRRPRPSSRTQPSPQLVAAGSSAVLAAVFFLLALAVGGWALTRTDDGTTLVPDPPVTATPDSRSPALPDASLTKAPGVSLCLPHCDRAPTTATSAPAAPTTAPPQVTAPSTATTATTVPEFDPATEQPADDEPFVEVELPELLPREDDEAPPVTEAPEPETTTTEGTTPPDTEPTSEEDEQ